MDQLPSLSNIDFTKYRSGNKGKGEFNPPPSSTQTASRSKRFPGPNSTRNRAENPSNKAIMEQPRVTIPSSYVNTQQYSQHSAQSPFSASTLLVLSPSSTYSAATPISSASPQTPWLQHEVERPMAFLAPDTVPQSFPPSSFSGGIQYPISYQQHSDPGSGSQYQYQPYMHQHQMDYILDSRSNLNMNDNKHNNSSSFGHTNDNSYNTYTVNNSGMAGAKAGVGVGNLASPKGQMQWYAEIYKS